jgi:hypothetical protein
LAFEYRGEADYIGTLRYRLQCKMEKTPGCIIVNGKQYHIDAHGHYVGDRPAYVKKIHELVLALK